ncbi:hypothetical protein GGU11DRAFT_499745 [Lentinula aff. detonsa]|nr:hypothetical protein GGU11DRAFT_499745 [Lentinula aff. detonsa]
MPTILDISLTLLGLSHGYQYGYVSLHRYLHLLDYDCNTLQQRQDSRTRRYWIRTKHVQKYRSRILGLSVTFSYRNISVSLEYVRELKHAIFSV